MRARQYEWRCRKKHPEQFAVRITQGSIDSYQKSIVALLGLAAQSINQSNLQIFADFPRLDDSQSMRLKNGPAQLVNPTISQNGWHVEQSSGAGTYGLNKMHTISNVIHLKFGDGFRSDGD